MAYAVYVWAGYGITFAMLAGLCWHSWRSYRYWKKRDK